MYRATIPALSISLAARAWVGKTRAARRTGSPTARALLLAGEEGDEKSRAKGKKSAGR